jgi:hypothetical protein
MYLLLRNKLKLKKLKIVKYRTIELLKKKRRRSQRKNQKKKLPFAEDKESKVKTSPTNESVQVTVPDNIVVNATAIFS